MSTWWQDEKGQTLPLVLLVLLVLLGMAALVIDGGNAYAQKRRMQNAADAGALSVAMIFVKGENRDAVLRQTATRYAQANGADTAVLNYLDAAGNVLQVAANGFVPADTDSFRVMAQRTFPTYFARLLGFFTMTAQAQAKARPVHSTTPRQLAGLSPLSVPTNFYQVCASPGSRCDLWDPSYAAAWGIPASQFKALIDLSNGTDGNLPQRVSEWTRYGYPGITQAGVYLPTISGNYGNNVADALRQRIIAQPEGVDPDGVIWGTIIMGIWDTFEPENKDLGTPMRVHIAKFGRFKIRLTDVYGSHTYGHFIDFVVPGHDRASGGDPAGPTIIVLGD